MTKRGKKRQNTGGRKREGSGNGGEQEGKTIMADEEREYSKLRGREEMGRKEDNTKEGGGGENVRGKRREGKGGG